MSIGLLGKKLGMSQLFAPDGTVIPVTLIEAGPCPVLQVKTAKIDGYQAVQLGFDPMPDRKGGEKRGNKPEQGHAKKAGQGQVHRLVREFRTEDTGSGDTAAGSMIDLSLFAAGDKIDVTGISKGRGFAGPMKRHNSHRGPETHGSMYHRRTGSIGQSAWPSHVFKGKPMAGHMGAERTTVQNVTVVRVDKENNVLIVRGAIPGHANGYVILRKAVRSIRAKKTRRS